MPLTPEDAWTFTAMPQNLPWQHGPTPEPSTSIKTLTGSVITGAVGVADLGRRLNDVARQFDYARATAAAYLQFDYAKEAAILGLEAMSVAADIEYVRPFAAALPVTWAVKNATEIAIDTLRRQAAAMEAVIATTPAPKPGTVDAHAGTLLGNKVGLTDADPNWGLWGGLLSDDQETIVGALLPGALPVAPPSFGSSLVGLLRTTPSGSKEILMVATKRNPNQFQPVGGRNEPGEEPLQTALREVEEEVGIKLPTYALEKRLVSGMRKRQGDMVFYSAELSPAQAEAIRTDDPEFAAPARWMSIEEALAQPSFPSTKSFLTRLLG
jgi:8-oxo-dGTP pyrophosphatase MutT (NUDIX family)